MELPSAEDCRTKGNVYLDAGQFFLLMSRTISKPAVTTLATLIAAFCALTVPGQDTVQTANDAFFRNVGYIVGLLTLLTLAVAAIYGAWKKQALAEASSLAATRKEMIAELERDKATLKLRVNELERENERLEKKNLRLQDERGRDSE
jgi:hypothetical protein